MTLTLSGSTVRACAHPRITPRLVIPAAQERSLGVEDERRLRTFAADHHADLIAELARAGLRGRGGAGFPTARKLRSVRDAEGPRVIVANGSEGEPSSLKDRWLLFNRPHLILDGLFRAARAIAAERAVVYLGHEDTELVIREALAESDQIPGGLAVDVHVAPDRYVAGEESAVCRAINGGPALPTDKPPRPFQRGVDGRPTAVVNVETLAHASVIARDGAVAYRGEGTDGSPGTTLVTLGGCCRTPGVYEVPFGMSVRELFESVGGGLTQPAAAFLIGGWFGGVLDWSKAKVICCYDAIRELGTGLGCAAFTAIGQDEDPLRVAAEIGAWYARESAQQCGVCVKGTVAIAGALERLADGEDVHPSITDLARWGRGLRGRGACALLDGAAMLAASVATELTSHSDNDLSRRNGR